MILNGDRGRLGAYIRDIADLMQLRDWTVVMMSTAPDNPKLFAAVERLHGRKWANFYIQDDWTHATPERMRQTVVHELLHLHIDPAVKGTLNAVADQVTPAVSEVITNVMDERVEYAVDAIAEAWAMSLPLPVEYAEHVEIGRSR